MGWGFWELGHAGIHASVWPPALIGGLVPCVVETVVFHVGVCWVEVFGGLCDPAACILTTCLISDAALLMCGAASCYYFAPSVWGVGGVIFIMWSVVC